MHNPARGAASTGLIVGLVIVIAAVVGGLYMFSDVFRTKANTQLTQWTEWTPENIAADPVNYLNFAEEQAETTLSSLEATRISIAQRRATLESMQTESRQKIKTGDSALIELKAAYKTAAAADPEGAFDVEWSRGKLDKKAAQRQIISLDQQLTRERDKLVKVDAGLVKLDAQEVKIADAKVDCQNQLEEIQTNREMLKVNELTDDLTDQLVELKGVLAATVASAGADAGGVLSLDDITEQETTTVDDAEFEAILNK